MFTGKTSFPQTSGRVLTSASLQVNTSTLLAQTAILWRNGSRRSVFSIYLFV